MIQSINRIIPPASKEIGKIKIQEAKKSSLDNGIPVYAINAGFQDLVKVEFLFLHHDSFNPAQPIIDSGTNRMLSEGSSRHNAQQLAEMVDRFGAFYETEEAADYNSVVLFTLNKYLDQTLPILFEILTDPTFPENELLTFKQNNRQRLIVESEKVNAVARRKFNEVIFGSGHSYGHYIKPDDYEKLTRQAMQAYHKKNYHSNCCNIIVAGRVNDETTASLNKFFGLNNWEGRKKSESKEIPVQSSFERKHLIEKKDAVQSAIRIGKILFNKTHPDYIGMTILNTALGGYFGSRLMSNIREDKGYTYSIGSAVVSMKQAGSFFISTEVGADVTSLAIDEIHKEIERLRNEPLETDELMMVKNYMMGSFLKGIDGAFQLADRWKGLLIYGLEYEYFYRYLDTIRTIKADELMALAKKHLDLEYFYEVVVGKK
jgi:zinc protease